MVEMHRYASTARFASSTFEEGILAKGDKNAKYKYRRVDKATAERI